MSAAVGRIREAERKSLDGGDNSILLDSARTLPPRNPCPCGRPVAGLRREREVVTPQQPLSEREVFAETRTLRDGDDAGEVGISRKDSLGAGYRILSELSRMGVNFLAFNAIPIGPANVQLVLFPEDAEKLIQAAEPAGLALTGPQKALLIQGEDRLGELADIHRRLFDANVDVYAASGVTSDSGYGYLLYVKPEQFESAAQTLEV